MNTYQSIILKGSLYTFLILIMTSCKSEWLDVKPDKSLVIPTSAADYQALLDNTGDLFTLTISTFADISSDDVYTPYNTWLTQPTVEKNVYIWKKDQLEGNESLDWNLPYQQILPCNIVLDGLKKINSIDEAFNNVKGTALFYRAFNFYTLAQGFCKQYDVKTANIDNGIPLKLSSNINTKVERGTVTDTYRQIINDLHTARTLLPMIPLYKTRPSIPAVYAMLARVYLSMEDYENARLYADSCLQNYKSLIDYNTLNSAASRPIRRFNAEVILKWDTFSELAKTGSVDEELFNSYSLNDLRRSIFFNPTTKAFKGSYDGSSILFNGLATDEVYLIRSECFARKGETLKAMADLNLLLENRFVSGTFKPFNAETSEDALTIILTERRKELCFRGLRWSDLRRLNKDPRFKKTLKRSMNGQIYLLPPNDSRYTFEIPRNEINITGIQQNER